MKLIKFNKDCKYQIVYHREFDPVHMKLLQNFEKGQTIYVDIVLEQHKTCVDIAYDKAMVALFGLKHADFEEVNR